MLKAVGNFCREHVLATVVTSLIVGGFGGVGLHWAVVEQRINRQEDQTLSEYNELLTRHREFLHLISAFTEDVAVMGVPDAVKRTEVSAAASSLYTHLEAFAWNVPLDQRTVVKRVQSSINEVRKRVQLLQTKADLDPLAVAFQSFYEDMEAAQPVIQGAAGKFTPVV